MTEPAVGPKTGDPVGVAVQSPFPRNFIYVDNSIVTAAHQPGESTFTEIVLLRTDAVPMVQEGSVISVSEAGEVEVNMGNFQMTNLIVESGRARMINRVALDMATGILMHLIGTGAFSRDDVNARLKERGI